MVQGRRNAEMEKGSTGNTTWVREQLIKEGTGVARQRYNQNVMGQKGTSKHTNMRENNTSCKCWNFKQSREHRAWQETSQQDHITQNICPQNTQKNTSPYYHIAKIFGPSDRDSRAIHKGCANALSGLIDFLLCTFLCIGGAVDMQLISKSFIILVILVEFTPNCNPTTDYVGTFGKRRASATKISISTCPTPCIHRIISFNMISL